MKWIISYKIQDSFYCPISIIQAETIERVQSIMKDINYFGYRLVDIQKIDDKEVSL